MLARFYENRGELGRPSHFSHLFLALRFEVRQSGFTCRRRRESEGTLILEFCVRVSQLMITRTGERIGPESPHLGTLGKELSSWTSDFLALKTNNAPVTDNMMAPIDTTNAPVAPMRARVVIRSAV